MTDIPLYGAGAQNTGSPTLGALVDIDQGGAVKVRTPLSAIGTAILGLKNTAVTTAVGTTLTAAALTQGQITRTGPTAAYTDTTDTVTNIVTAMGGFVSAAAFLVRIRNITAYPQTLAGGTGVTMSAANVVGPMEVAQYIAILGGTAASPTLTFTHMFTTAVGLAQSVVTPQATALSTVGAGTIAAAAIVGGIVTRSGSQANAAFTDTTDTATAIVAASVAMVGKVGASFMLVYQNSTNANATITGGTGVTVSGVTVVPGGATAVYLLTQTAANTITMVGILLTSPSSVSGTFTANGATPVTVTDSRITANSVVIPTLKTVGGTVGALPAIKTITAGTGFTVAATASDTSVYNYLIIG